MSGSPDADGNYDHVVEDAASFPVAEDDFDVVQDNPGAAEGDIDSAASDPASTPAGGKLILVGTPIGNLGDASERMQHAIAAADVIAAEDTRRFLSLTQRLELTHTKRVISVFDHNEQSRAPELVELIRSGQTVVLLSDAGMPAVSDPGYRVVKACAEAGLPITSTPGPSAVLMALAVSGLPSDRFSFEGFLPRKSGARKTLLEELRAEKRTMVFFESPHRIAATMDDFLAVIGPDRPMAISRELTKTYEETLRGTVSSLRDRAADGLRGELTLVLAGGTAVETAPEDHLDAVGELVESGVRAKDAAGQIAKQFGLSKREVYEAWLHRV
ncbi:MULTISPECIES: 16S rRNA (cytidine(1402)-2'-O)-methyltransferase [Brevibacterium]|uniref:Ribosomal RNA small subunit methyltransferase I n=1 Tax=Brevibacterium antiquum CNRZ 918 TaxID=1255637 RepID=A0A2H1KV70_9MICO|nr:MULTISPECIES: 16S rRNA (cytidine(1402)-2'-O)-methyltransferase [Brevibacterium]SMY03558.1 16S rRNA (cytidine1402-2'-O)-methyltransferase [Brevibacterium antiquum CNRZ 918]HCG55544.1 16S rRNA (cytidine(1402)-2'-O)-methyltransferase [Brevibacterium sp.]